MIKTQIIYNMNMATQLVAKGHKVRGTMPNPFKPDFTAWVFEVDDTFELDFEQLKPACRKGGMGNG